MLRLGTTSTSPFTAGDCVPAAMFVTFAGGAIILIGVLCCAHQVNSGKNGAAAIYNANIKTTAVKIPLIARSVIFFGKRMRIVLSLLYTRLTSRRTLAGHGIPL